MDIPHFPIVACVLSNGQLLLTAHASEAARSLRSRAASSLIGPQQNCERYAAATI
jgi:hypothetical protein